MPTTLEIKLSPEQASNKQAVLIEIAVQLAIDFDTIQDYIILRKSMDARSRDIKILLKLEVYLKNEKIVKTQNIFNLQAPTERTCHIIGFGPAGIFAALQCLEMGIKPIVIERGKEVTERLGDIAAINRRLEINPESNYCYGEGGAGTYSDGKLYTRSTKRGNVKKVLDTFIQHGADEKIGFEAHPHIGTNKLPKIIAKMRASILAQGGEIHFKTKLTNFTTKAGKIDTLICNDSIEFPCQNLILATGHSARDIFELLHKKEVLIEAKPFALGVRIEHTQELIDSIQYKRDERGPFLPPASYSLVSQACGRGVFSFCMCPGGVIASASTAKNEIVINGWSSSARNGQYSNSGIVTEIGPNDWQAYIEHGPLAALKFQESIEQIAFQSTESIVAPGQRVEDFVQQKVSSTLPRTSYQPGIVSRDLQDILPKFVTDSLRQGMIDFGKKMRGYRTNDAVLVGVESRSSSPVRIPRDRESLHHPQFSNLVPCGEGAGYAGGIVSAAIDGMRCALSLGE